MATQSRVLGITTRRLPVQDPRWTSGHQSGLPVLRNAKPQREWSLLIALPAQDGEASEAKPTLGERNRRKQSILWCNASTSWFVSTSCSWHRLQNRGGAADSPPCDCSTLAYPRPHRL